MASPSPPSWPHEKHRQLLSRDDYIDLRNSQDQQLNAEFTSVRCSIDLVRQELKNDIGLVKEEVGLVKQELKEFKDDVKAQTQRLEAQIRQSHAYMRNNALKNPSLPIRPVVVYRPEQGILEPELSQFPRNANEFYSLRDPRTDRHRSMLAYLAVFYDVRLRTADYPSEDDSGDDETFLDRPDIVVEKLEDILGLNEDKFDKFRERARQLATQSPSKPIKRSQIFLPDEESIPSTRRQRLELRPTDARDEKLHIHDNGGRQSPKSASSEDLTNARLGWGTRSTPSSRRLRIRHSQEPEHVPVAPGSQPEVPKSETEATVSDSETHAFTSSREP
ncbi:wac domain-containing protein [Colletotrichum incanum]|uniref:Wac domain-containing protein n=1 Tax=Colletotrichum incanum TaxID=1573173 RepID=A0A167A0R8_COLIC|nr:wac domain-containing protein [Colletotrichum incanum]